MKNCRACLHPYHDDKKCGTILNPEDDQVLCDCIGVENISLKDLRPCDSCGGPISPIFYRLTIGPCVINTQAVQEFDGMFRYFGGQSEALAEIFTPSAGEGAYASRNLEVKAVICNNCVTGLSDDPDSVVGERSLMWLIEKIYNKEKSDADEAETTPHGV